MKRDYVKEARLLRTLAHPGRLAIVAALRTGSACVCHLTGALGRPQAYLSQQLAILRDEGIIEGQREGLFVYYQLRDYSVLGMVDLASRFLGNPQPDLSAALAPLRGCECPRCNPLTPTAAA